MSFDLFGFASDVGKEVGEVAKAVGDTAACAANVVGSAVEDTVNGVVDVLTPRKEEIKEIDAGNNQEEQLPDPQYGNQAKRQIKMMFSKYMIVSKLFDFVDGQPKSGRKQILKISKDGVQLLVNNSRYCGTVFLDTQCKILRESL